MVHPKLCNTTIQLLPGGRVFVTVLAYAFLGSDEQVARFLQDRQVADGSRFRITSERDWLAAFSALDIIMVCSDFDVDTVVFQLNIEDFYTTKAE